MTSWTSLPTAEAFITLRALGRVALTEAARLGGVGDHPERGVDERDGAMELALEILEVGLEIERGSKSEIFPLTFLYFPSLPFTRPNEERGGGVLISEIFLWRSLEEERVILRVEALE